MSSEHTPSEEVAAPGKFPFVKVGIVLVIGVVLVVGVFSSEGARKNRAQMQCVSNLKQMDGAVASWCLENKKAMTDTYSLSDTSLLSLLKGSTLRVCPSGGAYTAGTNL